MRAAATSDDQITVDAGNVPVAALVRALVLSGVEVSEVTPHRDTLEHHFLQLTADQAVSITKGA